MDGIKNAIVCVRIEMAFKWLEECKLCMVFLLMFVSIFLHVISRYDAIIFLYVL